MKHVPTEAIEAYRANVPLKIIEAQYKIHRIDIYRIIPDRRIRNHVAKVKGKVLRAYASGVRVKLICSTYGISETTFYKLLGDTVRRQPRPTREKVKGIQEAYADGVPINTIGKMFGMYGRSIYGHLPPSMVNRRQKLVDGEMAVALKSEGCTFRQIGALYDVSNAAACKAYHKAMEARSCAPC